MFATWQYSDAGSRAANQDFAAWDDRQAGRAIWVLADGLGGHAGGETAARLAVETVMAAASRMTSSSDTALMDLLRQADQRIRREQAENPSLADMRTTLVMAVVDQGRLRFAHVGDSRLYYFKNGCLFKQTRDHSLSQAAVDLGEISAQEIRFHEDRAKLLKVLGDTSEVQLRRLDEPILIEPGDAFLLCTDGFWEYVWEAEMELDLVKSATPQAWVEAMLRRLLGRVSGQHDNLTALGIFAGASF